MSELKDKVRAALLPYWPTSPPERLEHAVESVLKALQPSDIPLGGDWARRGNRWHRVTASGAPASTDAPLAAPRSYDAAED